jgi:5-(carboxyamino)imidazole ribonucleotide synthase
MVEKIGIVGGGQLGRMLTEAAQPLGFHVAVIDPTPNCPASQVGAEQIQADLKDTDAVAELADKTDVLTWEIEHIDSKGLTEMSAAGYNIQPDPETLSIIQDKFDQKDFLRGHGLPVSDFRFIWREKTLRSAVREMGSDLIIKSRTGGYDGRGNLVYKGQSIDDIHALLGQSLYVEKIVDFDKELSVVAARDLKGNIAVYPTVETLHKDNICHTVASPANIDTSLDKQAQEVAYETLSFLRGAGIFAIEMFSSDEGVIINEIAPRVHNSGHQTIEANVTSQFEQHIRAITGMPLGSTAMRAPAAVMINILGKRQEALTRAGLDKVLAMPDTHPHFYGKSSRVARKIGHITVLAKTGATAMELAKQAREALEV